MDKVLFGVRLNLARKKTGLSLRELATRLNGDISHTALAKYEKGVMFPSTATLIDISKTLKVAIDFFYREVHSITPYENFEKVYKLGKKEKNMLLEKIREEAEKLDLKKSSSMITLSRNNVTIKGFEDLIDVSLKLREDLNLGLCSLTNLKDELTFSGIYPIAVDSNISFKAFPFNYREIVIIPYNRNLSKSELLYEIAYQLGRLILSGQDSLHKFTLLFLIPPPRLKQVLGGKRDKILKKELDYFRSMYGVEEKYILELAHLLKILSRRKYQKNREEFLIS